METDGLPYTKEPLLYPVFTNQNDMNYLNTIKEPQTGFFAKATKRGGASATRLKWQINPEAMFEIPVRQSAFLAAMHLAAIRQPQRWGLNE
ncbi:MAG TPA: hypothetical protein VK815_10105 [Candidatus Acidoferrales bacterium]|nr:hypothetical protein [Candidatus Acidoferrales bacterium]